MKNILINLLLQPLAEIGSKLSADKISEIIETPPTDELGDYSLPCFIFSKELGKNPALIAQELKEKFQTIPEIEKIETKGPYLNFFLDKNFIAASLLSRLATEKENFGKANNRLGKLLIEFPSPNTNKPLHIGHLRNMAIGEAMARILEWNNNDVVRTNLTNDRGVHICKSMLAYQKFGNEQEPNKKSDHFVGDFYVKFSQEAKNNPALEDEVQEMLVKWEAGDPEVRALWKKMNDWAFAGMAETYKLFGTHHDKNYYESEIYTQGREIIMDGLARGIFKKRADGAIVIDLTDEGLDEKVLLRADGTSIYITQDIYLAKLKSDDYDPDGSIYVVGNEQEYHFKVLFSVLKRLGYKFANNLQHLSYGMVELPEGRMKSREGTVVDADDLIAEVRSLAEAELKNRYPELPEEEISQRALKIALAAIKYQLLKVDVAKTITFNPKESISFEGDTGPYILYAYARAASIIDKTETNPEDLRITGAGEFEGRLAKKIYELSEVVKSSAERYNPALVAHYAYSLSQSFNEFYHHCPVIGSEQKELRLALVAAFMIAVKKSLNLLGIETIEKM